MRLDITSKRGEMLVYIKSSLPSRIMSNFKLPENIQVIPFELNLRKEKWLFVSVYKPPLQSNNYFLDTLNDLLDFYSGIYDNKVVFGDFNLEPTNPVIMNLMDSQNFTNLIKNNTCFKVGLSPSKKNFVLFASLKIMKNAFYFILNALLVLKIFKFLL